MISIVGNVSNFRSDEGLTLETSALKLFAVANFHSKVDKTRKIIPLNSHHPRSTTVSLETYPLYK